jgi:hypothetical protein
MAAFEYRQAEEVSDALRLRRIRAAEKRPV